MLSVGAVLIELRNEVVQDVAHVTRHFGVADHVFNEFEVARLGHQLQRIALLQAAGHDVEVTLVNFQQELSDVEVAVLQSNYKGSRPLSVLVVDVNEGLVRQRSLLEVGRP